MKKKIVIVTNIPSPYRVDLFYYLQKFHKEYDWTIIYTNKTENGRNWDVDSKKLMNSIILHAKVFSMKAKTYKRNVHFFTDIKKHLDIIKPDLIIAFEYNPAAIQSFIWAKFNKRKFINLTDGTIHSERDLNVFQLFSRKLLISNSDAYIASSTRAKEKLQYWNADPNKIFISLLTEDLSSFINTNRATIKGRLLYVGNILYGKGLDLLFDALGNLDVDFSLHIVGDGDAEYKNSLIYKTKSVGIDGKVTWCGFKTGEELYKEYSEADLFVFPTREDCFGLVLLEAAAMGIPIISSKFADGVYDIIGPSSIGSNYIVDPNGNQEFSNAILKSLNASEKLKSNIDVSKFSFDEVSKGYIEAIKFTLKE